jgi:hypothetical protein
VQGLSRQVPSLFCQVQKAGVSGMAGGTGDDPKEPKKVQHPYLDARRQGPEVEMTMNTLLNYPGEKWSMIARKSYNQNADQRTEVLWCNFEVPSLFQMEDI